MYVQYTIYISKQARIRQTSPKHPPKTHFPTSIVSISERSPPPPDAPTMFVFACRELPTLRDMDAINALEHARRVAVRENAHERAYKLNERPYHIIIFE